MTCAFAVRGAFKRLSGVESADVSLNKGVATVKLKPGNKLTVEQFWEAVRNNGFTPKDTRVVVRGEICQSAGRLQLKVTETNRTYELVSDPKVPKAIEDVKRQMGKTLIIEGTLVPGKNLASPVPIRVRASRL